MREAGLDAAGPTEKTRVFLAGATGAIGRRLVPLLVARGHEVIGTSRSADRARGLAGLGAQGVAVDVLDAATLREAVLRARPDIVIHQLTDLGGGFAPGQLEATVRANAHVRTAGTANLVQAALAAGATRMLAQSISWACVPLRGIVDEDTPLDVDAPGLRGVTVGGVAALERQALGTPGLRGTVLRYGQLYGPGTGADSPEGKDQPLHVDAAAWAVVAALEADATGLFNIVQANDRVSTRKAQALLGWDPQEGRFAVQDRPLGTQVRSDA
jgi:nucleoside-diphosphate-sugar epimerase